jgi:hypothetical protein
MKNNVIKFNQHNELEQQLKRDADKLNDEVTPQLREQLFYQLSRQPIENKQLNHATQSFAKNKMAIAASLIFSVFVIQFFVAHQPVEETSIASSNSIHNIDEMLLGFSAELKNKDLLASQDLNAEYKAILADMDKIKQRIVKL